MPEGREKKSNCYSWKWQQPGRGHWRQKEEICWGEIPLISFPPGLSSVTWSQRGAGRAELGHLSLQRGGPRGAPGWARRLAPLGAGHGGSEPRVRRGPAAQGGRRRWESRPPGLTAAAGATGSRGPRALPRRSRAAPAGGSHGPRCPPGRRERAGGRARSHRSLASQAASLPPRARPSLPEMKDTFTILFFVLWLSHGSPPGPSGRFSLPHWPRGGKSQARGAANQKGASRWRCKAGELWPQ